jgi:hypothetical protein
MPLIGMALFLPLPPLALGRVFLNRIEVGAIVEYRYKNRLRGAQMLLIYKKSLWIRQINAANRYQ